jgi:uncharacterized membrane protein YcaP (DUF421 family)
VLHEIIGAQHDVNTWQMIVRAAIIFVFGVAILRIAGRRAFGQQSTVDIMLSIVIGSSLSRALTGGAPFVPTLAATAALVAMYWVATRLTVRSECARWLLKGKSIPLVRHGKPDPVAMRKLAVAETDLEEAMRHVGIDDLRRVDTAMFERSGKISIAGRFRCSHAEVAEQDETGTSAD